MKALKRHFIVLDLPTSVAVLIIFAKHVAALMANSAWFPNPTLTLAIFLAHIDALATYHFRYRTIVGAKTSAWSQSVSLRVV